MADELLTTADLRSILGVGQNAITRYLPEIRHFRLGNPRTGPVRIRRSDLDAWMERRMVAPVEETDGQEARARDGLPAVQRRPHHRAAAGRSRRTPPGQPAGRPRSVGGGPEGAGRDAAGAGPDAEVLRYRARRGTAA